ALPASRKRLYATSAWNGVPTAGTGVHRVGRAHSTVGGVGPLPVRRLYDRVGVLGPESRPGDGSGDSHLYSGDRAGAPLSAAIDRAGERDHHRHRRGGGVGGGGGHLHASGPLHTEARPAPSPDHLDLPGGRVPGRAVPDPAPTLLRPRNSRAI